MSQSLSILYTHATFGTKGRNPWINEEIANDLHAYMASIFKELDSPAVIINSMPDHIHVLFRMSKTVAMAEVIEETKKNSSKWMKSQPMGSELFYWQRGYGVFSVSGSHLDAVIRYIVRQNSGSTFVPVTMGTSETLAPSGLMKKYNVEEYNPEYYWD